MKTLLAEKAELIDQSVDAMKTHLVATERPLREKVALTCRILFTHGHDSGLAGQITARTETPGRYLTQRLGLGFDEITPANLLEVDEDLVVMAGDGMANPANRFHSWIYRARADVNCIVHTHPMHASALSLLERPLKVAHMDSCMLYDEVSFLARWPGVPVGNGGRADRLGAGAPARRAARPPWPGDRRAQRRGSLRARRAGRAHGAHAAAGRGGGEIRDIDPALAREAHDWILQPTRSRATFDYFARRALRELPF